MAPGLCDVFSLASFIIYLRDGMIHRGLKGFNSFAYQAGVPSQRVIICDSEKRNRRSGGARKRKRGTAPRWPLRACRESDRRVKKQK